jgi:hypothetical protein
MPTFDPSLGSSAVGSKSVAPKWSRSQTGLAERQWSRRRLHRRVGVAGPLLSGLRFDERGRRRGQRTILRMRCDDFNKESRGLRCQRGSIPAEALPPASGASLLSGSAAGAAAVTGATSGCFIGCGVGAGWPSVVLEGKVTPDENWMPPYSPPAFLDAMTANRRITVGTAVGQT